jgi:hypothetical protein
MYEYIENDKNRAILVDSLPIIELSLEIRSVIKQMEIMFLLLVFHTCEINFYEKKTKICCVYCSLVIRCQSLISDSISYISCHDDFCFFFVKSLLAY